MDLQCGPTDRTTAPAGVWRWATPARDRHFVTKFDPAGRVARLYETMPCGALSDTTPLVAADEGAVDRYIRHSLGANPATLSGWLDRCNDAFHFAATDLFMHKIRASHV